MDTLVYKWVVFHPHITQPTGDFCHCSMGDHIGGFKGEKKGQVNLTQLSFFSFFSMSEFFAENPLIFVGWLAFDKYQI